MMSGHSISEKKFITAIAGSAGSHPRVVEFFDHTPHDDVSYVILQHLPAAWRTQLKDILARHTKLSVVDIDYGTILQNDSVYVAPAGNYVAISGDTFVLTHRTDLVNHNADFFMQSLAANSGCRAIGIVLEGLLDDGTLGLRAIHKAGGLTLVQDPATCGFPGMPQSAIDAGVVDRAAAIKEMPDIIHEYVRRIKSRSLA